jgi:hypothetical protein
MGSLVGRSFQIAPEPMERRVAGRECWEASLLGLVMLVSCRRRQWMTMERVISGRNGFAKVEVLNPGLPDCSSILSGLTPCRLAFKPADVHMWSSTLLESKHA